MCNIFQFQLKLGLLVATFGLVVSCLITNCPRGGKRSENTEENQTAYSGLTESGCVPCGPDNQGVCLGSRLCCGRETGCVTSLLHTKACRNVRSFQVSCLSELRVPSCGDKGRCKSKYFCCTKDQCVMDPSCKFLPKHIEFDEVNEASPTHYSSHGFWPLQQMIPVSEDANQDGPNDGSVLWKSEADRASSVFYYDKYDSDVFCIKLNKTF